MEIAPVGENNSITPEDIEYSANLHTDPPPQLASEVGVPDNTRYLIKERLSQSRILALGAEHPRVHLHNFLVMEYPLVVDTNNMIAQLEALPYVVQASEDLEGEFSFAPNDPLYYLPFVGAPDNAWQWGMGTMNYPAAWDYVKGRAYTGVIDFGIEMANPDLVGSFRPHFSYNAKTQEWGLVDEMYQNTIAPYAGHGSNVAGIIAAASNNGTGVTGSCQECSLLVGATETRESQLTDAITRLTESGVELFNFSWQFSSYDNCSPPNDSKTFCRALQLASLHSVSMVAASGNHYGGNVQFPASDSRVIAVGAINSNNQLASFSNLGVEQDLVAPGVSILSTFYTDHIWNTNNPWNCGDSISAPSSYGPCTGTSMSSPMVAGLVALVKTVNPLLSPDKIRAVLLQSASNYPVHSNTYGYGVPDATKAVTTTLGTVQNATATNRLTPFFRLYSSTAQDTFLTVSPQMGAVAEEGTLQPRPEGVYIEYSPNSNSAVVHGYPYFPYPGADFGPISTPTADVYIAVSENNPFNSSQPLIPLYRFSYNNGTTTNVDHLYITNTTERSSYESVGYRLDGIEGYIFDKQYPQPTGSVRLIRRYNAARDDHAVFPEDQLPAMEALGYTTVAESAPGAAFLGYVYPNVDSDGDNLIDGMELMLGMNPNQAHSDCDLVPDGQEYPQVDLPLSDPLSPLYASSIISLTNHTVTALEQKEACDGIQAGQNYSVAGNLVLLAGKWVDLQTGFSVTNGGTLRVQIGEGQ